MTDQKFNRFSVPLGLLDYVNPIFYTITMLMVDKKSQLPDDPALQPFPVCRSCRFDLLRSDHSDRKSTCRSWCDPFPHAGESGFLRQYRNPDFHVESLADLNVVPEEEQILSREQEMRYFLQIKEKIQGYLGILTDEMLSGCPEGSGMSRLRLIIGQHRHWHRHMGIVYGFVIEDTGKWPYVLNMDAPYPDAPMPNYYE